MTDAHTAAPWVWHWAKAQNGDADGRVYTHQRDHIGMVHCIAVSPRYQTKERWEADARLMAAAPEMLAALLNVRKLIAEAAETGFNWKDGDWAERLFASQQVTSAAIKKASP